MNTQNSISDKLLALCQAITEDTDFISAHQKVQNFFNDDAARNSYTELTRYGDSLRELHAAGSEPTSEQIGKFNDLRQALLDNPVAFDFISAKQQVENMAESISQMVRMTFELGRVPTQEDLEMMQGGGCCGGGGCDDGGCGCGNGGCGDGGCDDGGCGCK